MSFFSKFYLELMLILTIGLLMNPDNGMLKLSIFFLFIFWAVIHVFIVKRLFSDNEMLTTMIKEDDEDINEDETKSKLIKNLKRFYYIAMVLGLLIASLCKGGFFIIVGSLIVITEIIKFVKVKTIIKKIENEKKTSSIDQEV